MMSNADLAVAIDPVFAARNIRVSLGCLLASVGASRPANGLGTALEAAAAAVRMRTEGGAASVPEIATTRRAYKACGKDPSRYRPASEALVRRVLKGEAPPRINPMVDLNTLVSLRTGLACGVYDRTRLRPPFVLRLGTADDIYDGIGRGVLNVEHLPVLVDALGPFGSPTSDSARSAVPEGAREVLMVLYAFDTSVETALGDARHAFEEHLDAKVLGCAAFTG